MGVGRFKLFWFKEGVFLKPSLELDFSPFLEEFKFHNICLLHWRPSKPVSGFGVYCSKKDNYYPLEANQFKTSLADIQFLEIPNKKIKPEAIILAFGELCEMGDGNYEIRS